MSGRVTHSFCPSAAPPSLVRLLPPSAAAVASVGQLQAAAADNCIKRKQTRWKLDHLLPGSLLHFIDGMALNSTQVVAKAQAETRGNFHSIQVMLGFQHADLNFPTEFHHEDVHQQQHDLATAAGAANMNTAGGWPSCAQQGHPGASSVTSTTGKKNGDKGGKKNSNETVNNATKKKKTRYDFKTSFFPPKNF